MADRFDQWLESELRSELADAGGAQPPQIPRYLSRRAATARGLRWARPAGRLGALAIISASLLLGGTAYAAVHLVGELPIGPVHRSQPTGTASSCHPVGAGCHSPGASRDSSTASGGGSHERAQPRPSAGPSPSSAAQGSASPSGSPGHHRAHPTPSHPAHPTHPPTPEHGKPSPSTGGGNGNGHSRSPASR